MKFKPGDIIKFPGMIGGERGLCFVLGVSRLGDTGARLYIMTNKHRFINVDVFPNSLLAAAIQRVNDD